MKKYNILSTLSLTFCIVCVGSFCVNKALGQDDSNVTYGSLTIRLPIGWHVIKEPRTIEDLVNGYFATNSDQMFPGVSEYSMLQEKDKESAILRFALNPNDYFELGSIYEGIAIETIDLFGELPEELNTEKNVAVIKSKGPYSTVYTFELEGNIFFISVIGDAEEYESLVLNLIDNFCIDNIDQVNGLNIQKKSVKARYSDEHYQKLILEVKSKHE